MVAKNKDASAVSIMNEICSAYKSQSNEEMIQYSSV